MYFGDRIGRPTRVAPGSPEPRAAGTTGVVVGGEGPVYICAPGTFAVLGCVGWYIYVRSRPGEFVCELVSLLHTGDEGGGGEDRDALDMSDRNGTERNGRSFNPWMGGMAVGGGVRWRLERRVELGTQYYGLYRKLSR